MKRGKQQSSVEAMHTNSDGSRLTFRLRETINVNLSDTGASSDLNIPSTLPSSYLEDRIGDPTSDLLERTNRFFSYLVQEQEKEALNRIASKQVQVSNGLVSVNSILETIRNLDFQKRQLDTTLQEAFLRLAREDQVITTSVSGLLIGDLFMFLPDHLIELLKVIDSSTVQGQSVFTNSSSVTGSLLVLPVTGLVQLAGGKATQSSIKSLVKEASLVHDKLKEEHEHLREAEFSLLEYQEEAEMAVREVQGASSLIRPPSSTILSVRRVGLPGPPLPATNNTTSNSNTINPLPPLPPRSTLISDTIQSKQSVDDVPSLEELNHLGNEPEAEDERRFSYRKRANICRSGTPPKQDKEPSMEDWLRDQQAQQEYCSSEYARYFQEYQQYYYSKSASAAAPPGMPPLFGTDKKRQANINTTNNRMGINRPNIDPETGLESIPDWQVKLIKSLKEEIVNEMERMIVEERASVQDKRQAYKQLAIRWHPDKNPSDPVLAQRIFQFLQKIKDWFLNTELEK